MAFLIGITFGAVPASVPTQDVVTRSGRIAPLTHGGMKQAGCTITLHLTSLLLGRDHFLFVRIIFVSPMPMWPPTGLFFVIRWSDWFLLLLIMISWIRRRNRWSDWFLPMFTPVPMWPPFILYHDFVVVIHGRWWSFRSKSIMLWACRRNITNKKEDRNEYEMEGSLHDSPIIIISREWSYGTIIFKILK